MVRSRRASPQTLLVFEALLDDPDAWQHGYQLSKRTGLPSGTLYPIMIRLADRGLLDSRWEPPEQSGRPPRHAYRLTADGLRAARTELAAATGSARPRLAPLWETP
jgi:PadR family transcriptional regulator, regulatory protein PadR